MNYAHIASRILGRPLLVTPQALQAVMWALSDRLNLDVQVPPAEAFRAPPDSRRGDGYRIADGGVAVVPVFGKLVQRSGFLDANSGLTSYDSLVERIDAAMADTSVRAVMGNFDTPGGEANGLMDAVDHIYNLRGRKPLVAMVADEANSAGYALASAFDEVVVTQTGQAGSIGVVMTHRDESQVNEKRGLIYTHLYAGEHKIDGSPYRPLSDQARAEFQADIDRLYDLFVNAVSRNRSLDRQAVIDTQARVFMGQLAVEAGLADRVSSPAAELQRLINQTTGRGRATSIPTSTSRQQEKPMTDITLSQEDLDARLEAANQGGYAEGHKTGATEERDRIAAILDHEHAAGRQTLARHLALHTDTGAEAAASILQASPAEQPPETAKPSKLDRAMSQIEQPQVAASEGDEQADDLDATVSRLVGRVRRA